MLAALCLIFLHRAPSSIERCRTPETEPFPLTKLSKSKTQKMMRNTPNITNKNVEIIKHLFISKRYENLSS